MERFQSSTFFPSGNGSNMNESIASGLPVFSRDVGERGAKSFFACGYDHFVEKYYRRLFHRKDSPHLYEVLQWHLPTKIYVDIDGGAEVADVDGIVLAFAEHMKREVQRLLGLANMEVAILTASSCEKRSFHLVGQVFMENIEAVKGIVAAMCASFLHREKLEAVLDMGVYTRNRSFRLLYASKKGSDRVLFLIDSPEAKDYNAEDVFRTLLQARLPDHYTGPLLRGDATFRDSHRNVRAMPGDASSSSKRTHRQATSNETTINISLPPRMIGYLGRKGQELRSVRFDGDFAHCIIGNSVCPFKGAVHRNNNQFFTWNMKTGTTWFKCPDTDCPDVYYKHRNLTWACDER